MTPQMGVYTLEDDVARMAAHVADADAHHPEEIAHGRAIYGATILVSIPGIIGEAPITFAPAANRIHYYPIKVDTPITLDQFVIEVTIAAAGGTRCRLAIYEADTQWQPTALVVDSGAVAIDAIAVVTAAIAVTLAEGRYLLAYIANGAPTLRGIRTQAQLIGYPPTIGASIMPNLLYAAVFYGAFADPGVAWDSFSAGATGLSYFVFVRVSVP